MMTLFWPNRSLWVLLLEVICFLFVTLRSCVLYQYSWSAISCILLRVSLALCSTTRPEESTRKRIYSQFPVHLAILHCSLHPFLFVNGCYLINPLWFFPFLFTLQTHTHTHTHWYTCLQTEQNKWPMSCSFAQPIAWSHDHTPRAGLVFRVTFLWCDGGWRYTIGSRVHVMFN